MFVTNNDGQWQPELHNGPKTHMSVLDDPVPIREDRELDRAEAIEANVDTLIDRVAKQKAVFSTHDLYRELHKHVSDPNTFQNVKAVLDAHLKKAGPSRVGKDDLEYFTVRKTLDTELELKHMATELLEPSKSHDLVSSERRERMIEKRYDFLSDEQKDAISHITGSERLSVVIGFAGTGKSTMLKAAADCWKSTGQRVIGAALAGIAAESLEQGADIKSGTIHSLLYRLDEGREKLTRGDVIVVDEAGMLDTDLMHRLMKQVHKSGAKVVLVGDAEQLQPIQAGGPLRSISEQGGYCEISTIRRQNHSEDREATTQLAKGNASAAWGSYQSRGQVDRHETTAAAIESLVKDTVADIEASKSIAVLAHSNAHVDAINVSVRAQRIKAGSLKNEHIFRAKNSRTGKTNALDIGVGDRILFRKNDTRMGVKNGSLGTITETAAGAMRVQLDEGKEITVDSNDYDEISHGYAMTIHKSQGVTVDQSRVLVSSGWDRHLSYVAMSRHKANLKLYYGDDSFEKRSVTETINQTRVQESAIDFANRHGIDVKAEGGEIRLLDQTADDMPSQGHDQDQKATQLLQKGSVIEAFRDYERRDKVKPSNTTNEAVSQLVADTLADLNAGNSVSILAHTNHAVSELNEKIRFERIASALITDEIEFDASFRKLSVGIGDTIVFDKDDKNIGVKKGDLGTVIGTESGTKEDKGHLAVELKKGSQVEFKSQDYNSISHAFAMTLHKAQSVDIDRARVLISNTYDRKLSSTAMSRHKKELTMYFGKDQFSKGSPVELMARERTRSTKKANTIKRGR